MARNIKIWIALFVSPLMIILIMAVALYLPPIQQWAVDMASRQASESMGMDVTVGRVRLAFPLNLSLESVRVTKQDSLLPQRKDTIAEVGRAVVNVQLLPLFSSQVSVAELEIVAAKINTIDIIPQARVKGNVGRMAIIGGKPIATVLWQKSSVDVKNVLIDDAHLDVALTDSVPEDTTETKNPWKIRLEEITVNNSDLLLHTPGDSLMVGVRLPEMTAMGGYVDLYKDIYRIESIRLKRGSVRYDNTSTPYSTTQRLDVNHVCLDDLTVGIDSLNYSASDFRLKIRELNFKEKSGLKVKNMQADVAMDSTSLTLGGMMKTPSSAIAMQLDMDFNAFDSNGKADRETGKVKTRVDAKISKSDLNILLNAADMDSYSTILPDYPISIKGILDGNMSEVTIPSLAVSLPTVLSVDMHGRAKGFMALAKDIFSPEFSASIHADLHTQRMSNLLSRFAPSNIRIPSMYAVADFDVKGADYLMSFKAKEDRGNIDAKARINFASMNYDAQVKAKNFNIGHFYGGLGLGMFSGDFHAKGKGFDVLSSKTYMKASAAVDRFDYGNYNLNAIKANASLKDGRAYVNLDAQNKLMDGKIQLDALMNVNRLDATLMTELAYIDLFNLHLVDKPLKVSVCTHIDAMSDFKSNHLLQGTLGDIYLTDSANTYRPDDITLDIKTDRDTTTAKVYCGDFIFKLDAQGNYKKLAGVSEELINVLKKQYAERTIDQEKLREVLPTVSLTLHSSKENPIYRFIKYYDIDYDYIDAVIKTSRHDGVKADLLISELTAGGYNLDTVALKIDSSNEPYEMTYSGYVRNVAPNEYVFNVNFDGDVLEHGISLNTAFYDANRELGLKLGAEATMTEEGIRLHLTPDNPVIGYETFRLKKDNYILLGHNNRVFADVDMVANGGTGIMLYSTANEENADVMQDITLSITKLDIKRMLSSIPYAPNANGLFDGDLHFVQEQDGAFSISSSINTKDLIYEGCPIGNLGADIVYMPKGDDEHYVDGVMSLDGNEIGTIKGAYNFNNSDINADLTLEKFPMSIINGFVPEKIIGLEGYAEGTLAIHGNTSMPDVNGELYLESASLVSVPYGTKMRFDDDPVRIVNSKLLFENFQMYANNNMPLTSYGDLDFSNLDHIKLNLLMRAENFLLIDSKETGRSEAYGKAYVNFLASIKGELDRLLVRGKLDVLPTTEVFYILRDSPLSNDNRMSELVKFTDLHVSDSISIQRPQVDGLKVNFNINVQNGSHIKCWLNDARSNYLDIIGEGELQMKYANDEMSMTGRYTISEGEIKYSLPVIPLKTFVISNGSYIEFTGDMMNPKLNITAKETRKASVNVNGTDRMVTFNTGVVLSKTLNDMGLEFVIEAPEDNTVSDELNMKSKEERGKLAVTMLTTGMYLSDGNTSSFSMNSALNSFLQSEINSIAGSALKTLDLSFGMDNSTEEDGTMHTNYSFKFAKRFWNNRLSISVGGKLSTGPDVSGQNKSFFDNVEVQYRLSDTSNKYLNLFYNRSVYDFLEGYVGQYGGGFLWKKKVSSLKEIFRSSPVTVPMLSPSMPYNNIMKTNQDSIKDTK